MTRKERDKMALRLVMDWLDGEADDFTEAEIRDGVRFALIGGEAPPWWAEVAYELRAVNREYRESVGDERVRCEACEGRGWRTAADESEAAA